MAIISNINGKFRVDSAGAVYFGTSAGTNGLILKSVGTGGSPVWVDPNTVGTGPWLPLAGGAITGNLTIGGTLGVTGALIGTSATFTGNVGIGSAPDGNPGTKFLAVGTAASVAGGIQLWAANNQTHFLQFGDAASGTGYYKGAVSYGHGTDTLALLQNAVTALSFTGTQAATFTGSITGLTSSFVSTVEGTTVVSAEGAYAASDSVKLFEGKRNGGAVASDWSYNESVSPLQMEIGTSTSHSFAIKTADTPRLTINNSGNVGIGTASPNSYDAESDDLVVFNSTTPGITIATDNTSSRGALRFADGTTGNEKYRGALEYDHNTDLMSFRTNGAQVMTLYDGGRLHPTGGVFLGSSNNDQLLSYYKEGNWEPEVYYQNATDQSNAVNVISQGKFTRIGNLVFVSFRLDFTQNGTPQADNIGVKNLPFNAANTHLNAGGNVVTSTSLVGLFLQTPTAGQSLGIINTSDNLGNYGNNFGSGTGKFIRGNMTYLAQ